MDPFALPASPQFERQIFIGNTAATAGGLAWQIWDKPYGKSMAHILCIGSGGRGGTGVIGAVSTAAGGGGGGSGGLTIIEVPLALLPDKLYLSIGMGINSSVPTQVSTLPSLTGSQTLTYANGGGSGGNASGATAGTAGTAGGAATNSNMSLGWAFLKSAIIGQVGIAGGTTGAGAALTIPTSGLHNTGGTGGAGLGLTGVAGTAGGEITAIANPSYFRGLPGGIGGSATTTPPGLGQKGWFVSEAGFYYYGGTGGGSTHGSATGAGAVQAAGGDGGIGSGGGGMGGAFTGSTAAVQSFGGSGIVIITCY